MKNNKSKIKNLIVTLVLVLLAGPALAGEMTYQPVNPNFGGSPFNGAPLLNSANAINDFEAPARSARDSARDFAERLDRAILSTLARSLTAGIINPKTGLFTEGVFETGINTITVTGGGTGQETTVVISNNETGETSTIIIPPTD